MTLDSGAVFFLNGFTGRSLAFDTAIVFFANYLPYLMGLFFASLLAFSSHSRREKLRILAVTAISVGISRFAITELIHFFYHRPRPYVTYQLLPLFTNQEWSFPSGHAALLFAMASAIFLFERKWGIRFFLAALLVTVSRVVAGVHYPSDILAGMVIGMASAYAVFLVAERTMKNTKL